MQIHENIAGEVRAELARRRLTGRKIARALGMSEVYVSRRLTGQVPFNVNDLSAIAELLDVPISRFFESPNVVRSGMGSINLRSKTLLVAAA